MSYPDRATEAQFQRTVEEMATMLGWNWHHETDSRKSKRGFPDLVLAHPIHGVWFLELKTATGRVRPEQREWIDTLRMAGANAMIVRPRDLDAVERILRGEK